MDDELTVDLDELGRATPRLGALAARVADDPAAGPALAGTAPGWATTAALEALRAAAVGYVRGLAHEIAATGGAVSAAVEEYSDADDRAARRLRDAR
jgi:hypothetical protein